MRLFFDQLAVQAGDTYIAYIINLVEDVLGDYGLMDGLEMFSVFVH